MDTTPDTTDLAGTDAGADAATDRATDTATDAVTDAVTDDGPLAPVEGFEPTSAPLIDENGRVRLSFSRIDTYRNCGAKFRYAYVDRLPGAPGPHLSFGTSIHAALEQFYAGKLPDVPSVDDLLGFLYDNWETEGFVELDRTEQVTFYRHAQDVLRRYHHRAKDDFRLPADTERWFELPVGDTALVVGSIDRVDVDVDGNLTVIDYKTNKKVRDRAAVRSSLQLAIYALACEELYGQLPVAVALDFVVPGVVVRVPIDEIDLDAARQAVLDAAEAIVAERYAPTPNNLCPWCDFRALCPAWEGEGPELLGPAVKEVGQLRRSLRRDVRRLRELEAGVERIALELGEHPDPLVVAEAGAEADGVAEAGQ